MKEPNVVLVLKHQTIKLYDEADYGLQSKRNFKKYENTFVSGDERVLTSRVGIELFEDDELVSSCLISSEGGGTGVFKNSALISDDGIIVCCANTIFKLKTPSLNLEWKTVSDLATCFSIHKLGNDYVVHGELEITRLDKNGKIIWQQGGRDIWITAEGMDDFVIYEDYILATDWDYNRYKIDFDGKIVEEYKIEPQKNEQTKDNL